MATERGMAGGSGRESTPTSGITQASPSPSLATPSLDSGSNMEPPAKRPKLKLNVRPPSRESTMRSQSPDTIAVARPRRDSSVKPRGSEDMVIDLEGPSTSVLEQKASPAASSDLSDLSSIPPPEEEQISMKEPTPSSSKSRPYGRDFMSYYVTGADDEENEEEDAPPPAPKPDPPRKQEPPKPSPVVQPPPPAIPQETRFKHHTVPPPYPPAKAQPLPRPAPPPLPRVNLIDTIKPARGPREPDTVAVMVKKLEKLSRTLTDFGGVPPIPQSPGAKANPRKCSSHDVLTLRTLSNDKTEPRAVSKPQTRPIAEKSGGAVDDFLAMFDDDESDEKDEQEVADSDIDSSLDYRLPSASLQDGPLKYGIVFIQNALRSWAYQRVTQQVGQQYQQMQLQARAENPPKRGPGRPRKFDNGDEQSSFPQNPPVVQFDLAATPEGAAIIAFQNVLDSGCLQLNRSLPIELSRALRHLYMQIDQLINQGSRSEPQWRCMSYGAQITAHKIRVEKWKEQQARAQQEMARQQQLANIQVMQQMGLPPNVPRVPMTAEQAQHAHAVELERRRGLQHAAQQPHLTKYITNPMSLDTDSTKTATGANNTPKISVASTVTASAASAASTATASASAESPAGAGPSKPPLDGRADSARNTNSVKSPVIDLTKSSQSPSNTPTAADLASAQLDKIKRNLPNYLPRSGQSMKFSFAPTSDLAIKAFGKDAFPNAGNIISSIPNRGPMNTSINSPTTSFNPQRQSNGATSTPGPNASAASPPALNRDNSDTIQVASVRRGSQSQAQEGKSVPVGKDGKALPTQSSMMGSFNASSSRSRSNSVSNGNARAPSASASNGAVMTNGTPSHLASRFPHPGAVVVDK